MGVMDRVEVVVQAFDFALDGSEQRDAGTRANGDQQQKKSAQLIKVLEKVRHGRILGSLNRSIE
jgi:hypothetical protein